MESLMNVNVMDLSGLDMYTTEQLDLISQNIMNARLKKFETSLIAMMDKVEKIEAGQTLLKDEVMLELDKREDKYQKQVDVAVNSLKVNTRNRDSKYIRQTDLGKRYRVNISSVSIGTLLRLCGLAWKNRTTTTPKMEFEGRYYIIAPEQNSGYDKIAYMWHEKNCMDRIDEWLKDNDYYEEFYSIDTAKEMKEYIKVLASKFDVAH